jgi:Synaptobrevin
MTRNIAEVLEQGERLDRMQQNTSMLASESKAYATRAKALHSQVHNAFQFACWCASLCKCMLEDVHMPLSFPRSLQMWTGRLHCQAGVWVFLRYFVDVLFLVTHVSTELGFMHIHL